MCTYSQLEKINLCNPPPQGVNGHVLYASSGKDISKCIEGGSMKLATQVEYIYIHVYIYIYIYIFSCLGRCT